MALPSQHSTQEPLEARALPQSQHSTQEPSEAEAGAEAKAEAKAVEAGALALAWLWQPPLFQKAEGEVEPSMIEPHQKHCHPLQAQPVHAWAHKVDPHAATQRTATA